MDAAQLPEVRATFSLGPVKTRAGSRTVTLPAAAVLTLAEHLCRWTAPALVFLAERGIYRRRSNRHRRGGCRPPRRRASPSCASTTSGGSGTHEARARVGR